MTVEEFIKIFQVPPAVVPYIDILVSPVELELVVKMGREKFTPEKAKEALNLSMDETMKILTEAYRREIINKDTVDGKPVYSVGTCYKRVEAYAMYENWGDVPEDARDAVIKWQLQEYIKKWQPVIEEILEDPNAYHKIPNRDVLSLEEALEQVEAAEEHVIVPCDCRSVVMACTNPVWTCIRFDEGARATLDRGNGKKITKEECKELVLDSDRRGLIHTGRRDYKKELYAMCNCCTCCCYPIRSSQALGSDKHYPRAHYMAERVMDKCIQCGLCVTRCPFGAFYKDGSTITINGNEREAILFDSKKCWGCGLCSTACPTEAIRMIPLEGESQ